jgi:hypothetical protein
MKFNRLGAFTLGVVITAVSVGAVSFVNAAGNANIKACANKKTGAMRYIAKGKCKTTETSLSWGQIGPQGLPGTPGASGTAGTNGTNGQNFHIIDATGRDLGVSLGIGSSGNSVVFLHDGGLWEINGDSIQGLFSTGTYYSDSSCSTSLAEVNTAMTPMMRGTNNATLSRKYYKVAGSAFLLSSRVVYAKIKTGSKPNFTYPCTASTEIAFINYFAEAEIENPLLSEVTEVTPPAYTAPFTIVAK